MFCLNRLERICESFFLPLELRDPRGVKATSESFKYKLVFILNTIAIVSLLSIVILRTVVTPSNVILTTVSAMNLTASILLQISLFRKKNFNFFLNFFILIMHISAPIKIYIGSGGVIELLTLIPIISGTILVRGIRWGAFSFIGSYTILIHMFFFSRFADQKFTIIFIGIILGLNSLLLLLKSSLNEQLEQKLINEEKSEYSDIVMGRVLHEVINPLSIAMGEIRFLETKKPVNVEESYARIKTSLLRINTCLRVLHDQRMDDNLCDFLNENKDKNYLDAET